MIRCTNCGEPIEFMETVGRGRMPINADDVPTLIIEEYVQVITPDGRVMHTTHDQKVYGYVTHWETCNG